MGNIGRLAPGLSSATSIRSLLERYERLDGELNAFESSVSEAAYGWEEGIELAVDAALGK